MRRAIGLAALALAACVSPRQPAPPEPGDWLGVAARAGDDVATLEALAAAFPDAAYAQRRLLAAAVARQDQVAAEPILARLAAMGAGFSDGAIAQIGKALPGLRPGWAHAFAANDRALPTSTVVGTIPGEFGLIEGVARDPRRGSLFATMVTGRGLLALAPDGEWRRLRQVDAGINPQAPPIASLSGAALSRDRTLLWLSAAIFEQTPTPRIATTGLLAVDVRTRKVARQIVAPAGVNPSDLTIGSDGAVYSSDPLGGAILVLRPGANNLDTLIAAGRFRSPQGLALSSDGRLLYVSDYGWGLAAIDLKRGAIVRIRAASPMMLDGIDWLGRRGEELIAIQNGTRPRRIVGLRLTRDGLTVDRLRVIERANPAWSEPAGAFIDGDHLLYVGDARWEEFGPGGARKVPASQAPVAIRAVPLD